MAIDSNVGFKGSCSASRKSYMVGGIGNFDGVV